MSCYDYKWGADFHCWSLDKYSLVPVIVIVSSSILLTFGLISQLLFLCSCLGSFSLLWFYFPFSNVDYSLSIIRKDVRSMTIRIKDYQTVQVTAPYLVPQTLIDRFVRQKSSWIEKQLCSLQDAYNAVRTADQELMIHGDIYRIRHSAQLHSSYHIDEDNKTVILNKPLDTEKAKAQRYKSYAKKTLSDRLLYYAELHNITFNTLYVRSSKSKWGSCSSDRNIGLNWKLIQFPEFVMDYVICHELAHIRHMNHSPAFWTHLNTLYPERKPAKARLRTYGIGLQ